MIILFKESFSTEQSKKVALETMQKTNIF